VMGNGIEPFTSSVDTELNRNMPVGNRLTKT
jgi:hypothetical protein